MIYLRTIPITTGKPGFTTRSGTKVIIEKFDSKRMNTVNIPTLLLIGSETASPHIRQAISSLQAALPNPTLVVLKGQQHNAMDTSRDMLATAIITFLLGTPDQVTR